MMYGPGFDGPFVHRGLGMMFGFGGGALLTGLLLIGAFVLFWLVARPHAAVHANGALGVHAHHVGHAASTATSAAAVRDTAEEIARERFARGEIDDVEFDRIIVALRAR